MSMWTYIKRGFGYSLGGRLGWEVGGLIWRAARWLALAVAALLGLGTLDYSAASFFKSYADWSQRQHVQQQQQHAQQR